MNLIHAYLSYGLWEISTKLCFVILNAWVMTFKLRVQFVFSDLDVGHVSYKKLSVETFNILFERTQNKNVWCTCTEIKVGNNIRNLIKNLGV